MESSEAQAAGLADATKPTVRTDETRRVEPTFDRAILDREQLLRRVDGRKDRAAALGSLFLEDDGPRQLTILEAAMAASDPEAVRCAAHALGGAVAELGAETAAAAARQLEAIAEIELDTQPENRAPGQLRENYETLKNEIAKLTASLEEFMGSSESES